MLRLNRWRRRTIWNDEKAEKLLNNIRSCKPCHISPSPTFQKKIIFRFYIPFPVWRGMKILSPAPRSPSPSKFNFRSLPLRSNPNFPRQQQKLLTFFATPPFPSFSDPEKVFFPFFFGASTSALRPKWDFFPYFFRVIFARPLSFPAKLEETGGRKGRPLYVYIFCASFFLEKLNPWKPFLFVRCKNEIRRNHTYRLPNMMPQE